MLTSQEIREDFAYLIVIEFAVLMAVSADSIYAGNFHSFLLYVLVFIGVVIAESRIIIALPIPREKDIRVLFERIADEKRNAKRMIAVLLVLLILLSSWGIISYLARLWMNSREYVEIVTMVVPWYIAIYAIWLFYLIYIKNRYARLVAEMIKRKREGIKHIFLFHGTRFITKVSRGEGYAEVMKEVEIHSEDFRYGNLYVMVETLGDLKVAVVAPAASAKLRASMKSLLKAIKINFPKKFETGNYSDADVQVIENMVRRYLL